MSYRSGIWAVIPVYARSPPSTSRASISHRGCDRWLLTNGGDQRQEHSDLLLRSLSPTERYLPDGVFRSGGHWFRRVVGCICGTSALGSYESSEVAMGARHCEACDGDPYCRMGRGVWNHAFVFLAANECDRLPLSMRVSILYTRVRAHDITSHNSPNMFLSSSLASSPYPHPHPTHASSRSSHSYIPHAHRQHPP